MALKFFEIEKGLSLNGNVVVLEGSGVPGLSTDTDNAAVGSFYLDRTNGLVYVKSTVGTGSDKWDQQASKAYVDNAVNAQISWREPVLVLDATSYADIAAVVTAANVADTLDGVTIASGNRVLITNLTSGNNNVYIVSGSTGNWTLTEDVNLASSGDTVYVQDGTYAGMRYTYNGTAWIRTDIISSDELGYIRAFIGKTGAGNELPTYSSVTQVTQSNTLEGAIGELDAAIGTDPTNGEVILAANTVNANIKAIDDHITLNNHKTTGTNITTVTVLDTVALASVDLIKWAIMAKDNATGLNRRGFEVLALHDGTNIDFTSYANIKLGSSISGFDFNVAINGANIELSISSSDAVDVEIRRIITV